MPVQDRYAATPQLRRLAEGRHAGTCQMEGCRELAHTVVVWTIDGYGTTRGWYCDAHLPKGEGWGP